MNILSKKKLFSDDDDASFFSQSKRGTASVNWDVVADLGYGESLVVVGNQSALGSGNVENGLSLVTSKEYWYVVGFSLSRAAYPKISNPNSKKKMLGLFGVHTNHFK